MFHNVTTFKSSELETCCMGITLCRHDLWSCMFTNTMNSIHLSCLFRSPATKIGYLTRLEVLWSHLRQPYGAASCIWTRVRKHLKTARRCISTECDQGFRGSLTAQDLSLKTALRLRRYDMLDLGSGNWNWPQKKQNIRTQLKLIAKKHGRALNQHGSKNLWEISRTDP